MEEKYLLQKSHGKNLLKIFITHLLVKCVNYVKYNYIYKNI